MDDNIRFFNKMTSKEYSLIGQESNSAASQKEKRPYFLRQHISKVHKYTPSGSSASNKNRFRSLKCVIEKLTTTNYASKEKDENLNISPQSFSDGSMDTNESNHSNFAGFMDMEADAFQLANYVESDAPIDEMISEVQKKDLQHLTPTEIFESLSISDSSLDELLDISIDELQKLAHASSASMSSVDSTSNGMETYPNIVVSDENNDASKCADVCGPRSGETAHRNDQGHASNSSNRHRSMLLKEPVQFVDLTVPVPIVRRLNPGGIGALSHSKHSVLQAPYTTLTKNVALKAKMFHLFNRPCFNYLNDRCSGSRVCKWSHSLPPAREIYHKLMLLNDETVKYMYFSFVLRNKKAFVTYFPSMCEVFGKRKMKSILVGAVSKCEERENIAFLKCVFNGLVLNGLSKKDALTTVTDCCSKSGQCYDVLLEMIIETDAVYFADVLKEYCSYGTIGTESMSKLFQQVIDAPDTALLHVFVDILDEYSMYGTFDEETFKFIIPRAKDLVKGNLRLTQQLNHIAKRMQ